MMSLKTASTNINRHGAGQSMKKRLALIAFFLVLAHPCFLQAFELKPFNSGNQSPLVRIYGLPFPGEAQLTPPGGRDFKARLAAGRNALASSARPVCESPQTRPASATADA